MAFLQCDFFSETLQISCSLNVIIPQRMACENESVSEIPRETFPSLYLLHGLSDDHTAWMRRTSIERYAANAGLAVIMPAVNRSFYANMYRGANYWDFISEEVPAFAERLFPLSSDPNNRFVAGLSMGGYGAFKLALNYPNRFAAAASLSGALDLAGSENLSEERLPDAGNIFKDAESVIGSNNDLIHLLTKAALERTSLPKLYQCCGTEDFLYDANQNFLTHAKANAIPLTYEEGPGEHEWGYWDTHIQKVIDWLPLEIDEEVSYK